MSATQLKNGMRAWHEELIEYLIVNPRASLQDIAGHFEASISWVSIVRNSDAFQEAWSKRRAEHFDRVSISVVDRVTALADITIDALTVKMENEIAADTISLEALKEVGDMALKALGFGAKHTSTSVNVQNNSTQNVYIDKSTLERARAARRSLQTQEDLLSPAPIIKSIELFPEITGGNSE